MPGKTSLGANAIHTTYRASLLQLADTLRLYPFLRPYEDDLRQISDNLQSPFNIAVFGRMKTGKSSLINALLGKQLTITGTEEATATINRITYAEGDRLNSFTVHWQDAHPQTFNLSHLKENWSGKSADVLERANRVAWLELYDDAEALKDIHIIDTPGTGSTAFEHELIAQQFISGQEADALIYVFAPTGHASDEESLSAFRDGCMPESSPDNTVGVLHKWDDIFFKEGTMEPIHKMAEDLHKKMRTLVSSIIPVSAPMGLLAKLADDSFWSLSRSVLSEFKTEAQLKKALTMEALWSRDELRKTIYHIAKESGCPWACFRSVMMHLFRNPEAREAELIMDLSGMNKLDATLNANIFSKKAIIQHGQNAARVMRTMRKATDTLRAELKMHQHDLNMLSRLSATSPADSSALNWLADKRREQQKTFNKIKNYQLGLDKLRINIEEWSDCIIYAHDLIPWLQNATHLTISENVRTSILLILCALLPNGEQPTDITWPQFNRLTRAAAEIEQRPTLEDRLMGSRLRQCLMRWSILYDWANSITSAIEVISWMAGEEFDVDNEQLDILMQILNSICANGAKTENITMQQFQALTPTIDAICRVTPPEQADMIKKLKICLNKWKKEQTALD